MVEKQNKENLDAVKKPEHPKRGKSQVSLLDKGNKVHNS